jgi:hypothetical protein
VARGCLNTRTSVPLGIGPTRHSVPLVWPVSARASSPVCALFLVFDPRDQACQTKRPRYGRQTWKLCENLRRGPDAHTTTTDVPRTITTMSDYEDGQTEA